MTGKCVKQPVMAIIEKGNQYYIGTNYCLNPQTECPRKDMPSGTGYELCKSVCQQPNHAEVNACWKAGAHAEGATLYLLGHTYCCDNCKQIMAQYGIKEVIIGQLPLGIELK